ncbi:MAG: RNA polymerase factor sigma-54 [Halanaerobium sp.]
MKLDVNINLEQKQELIMTPRLQMAIQILQYSSLELSEYIQEEIKENPLLDLLEANKDFNSRQASFNSIKRDSVDYENFVAYQPPFCEFLENQLFEVLDEEQIEAGKFIVGSMNQSGELTLDLDIIAELFDLTEIEAEDIYQKIKKLDIKHGADSAECNTEYIDPDLIVKKVDNEYKIYSNQDSYPTLRISSYYYDMLKKQDDEEISEYLKQKYQSALWLIKSIEQRRKTIKKIVEAIIKKQRDFFDKGLKHLYVMTMEEVAEEIEMHESTVSRATTSKYLQTPHGVFSLKFFFNSGIDNLSSVSIKAIISEEISKEEKDSPLSDSKLAEILSLEYGIEISRRTVAKYRTSVGIPGSRQRKRR